MANRRANSVVFGFDFQVNAAIVLFLENIKEMKSVRLEGTYEDIELELDNGRYIFAQAKAVTRASSDFSHVRANLKKSLKTLSEANENADGKADKLILITNSPNPFNDDQSRSCFWGHSRRDYSTLPHSAQAIIDGYISEQKLNIDTSLFRVQVVPFETDDPRERYKAIKEEINSFVGTLFLNIPGIVDRLMEFWHHCLMANAGTADESIKLHKKDVVWPLIVLTTDVRQYDSELSDLLDPAEYEEITRSYRQVIDYKSERYDFLSRVLFDFVNYEYSGSSAEKMKNFVSEQWQNYQDDIDIVGLPAALKKQLLQIIIYTILRQRFQIDRIREGVGL